MDLIGRIWRMHGQDQKSVRTKARETVLSRNAVSKWVSERLDDHEKPTNRRPVAACKLTPFIGATEQALIVDLTGEKKGCDWQHLPKATGGPYEAMLQLCLLAGRLPKPGS